MCLAGHTVDVCLCFDVGFDLFTTKSTDGDWHGHVRKKKHNVGAAMITLKANGEHSRPSYPPTLT